MVFRKVQSSCVLFLVFLFTFTVSFASVSEAALSSSDSSQTVVKHKTSNKSQAKAKKTKSRDSREIWLQRARNNPDTMLGKASWYGSDFNMRATASGVPYNMYTFTAAHRTLPFGTIVRVTDQYNGKSVMVCVTDRGPYVGNRIIDMSMAAATRIGLNSKGVSTVELEVVSDSQGRPLKQGEAFFVESTSATGPERFGPYDTFADAAAVHEAMLLADPNASVVLDSSMQLR